MAYLIKENNTYREANDKELIEMLSFLYRWVCHQYIEQHWGQPESLLDYAQENMMKEKE